MTHTVGIGALIEGNDYNTIRDIELHIADNTGNFHGLAQPPHVTVKAPFEVASLEDVRKIGEIMATIAAKTATFTITLGGISHFDQKVLFLEVLPNNSLALLHQQFLEALKPLHPHAQGAFEGDKVVFHSTLAMKLDDSGYAKSVDVANAAYHPSISTSISKLGLFLSLDGGKYWTVIKEAVLTQ